MNKFQVITNDFIQFETDSSIKFRNYVSSNFTILSNIESLKLVYPFFTKTINIDKDDSDFLNDLSYTGQLDDQIDLDDLTIIDDLDDHFAAENLQMIPVTDLNNCFNGFLGIGNKSHLKHWEI